MKPCNLFVSVLFLLAISTLVPSSAEAQWVQTNGPYGGTVTAMAVHGTNIFAGNDYAGGLYRSTDNGISWAQSGLANVSVVALAVDGSKIYAGGNHSGGDVFLSTDDGTTWNSVASGVFGFQAITSLVASDSILFAGASVSGVFRSTDGGANWNLVNTGLTSTAIHALTVSGPNLIAAAEGGIFISTDNGELWAEVNPELTPSRVISLATRDSIVYAGMNGGVLRSSDNGASWAAGGVGLPTENVNALIVTGNGVLAGTSKGYGIFRSTDEGATWTPSNAGLTNQFYIWSFVQSDTNLFVGLNFGGVCRSTDDGASWSNAGEGLPFSEVWSLASNGVDLYAGTLGNGVLLSTNGGGQWSAINDGLTITDEFPLGSVLVARDSLIFAALKGVGVVRSTNRGTTWIYGSGPPPGGLRSLVLDSSGNLLATNNAGVHRSTDDGASWSLVETTMVSLDIQVLTVDQSGNVFAGTYSNGVYLSTDLGTSWTPANTGMTTERVSKLASVGVHLIAGTPFNGTFISSDNGTTWTPGNIGLTDLHVLALAVSTTKWFLGNNQGVSYSLDNGASWSSFNFGMPPGKAYALMVLGTDLFVGNTAGVWRRPIPTNGLIEISVQSKWNLMSVPLTPGDFAKTAVFPTAESDAYSYDSGYSTQATLEIGRGYWLRFPADQTVEVIGTEVLNDTITLNAGWNLIGSLCASIPVSGIGSVPGGIVTSAFYGYDGSYQASPTIEPGRGYWMKSSQDGELILTISANVPNTRRIRIQDSGEKPPPPPDGEIPNPFASTPHEFALHQNYPNPFNPVTKIDFALPVSGHVTLKVFNVLGEVVATLADEQQGAGFKSVEFDAAGLASGVYIYRIVAGTFTDQKKLLLVR